MLIERRQDVTPAVLQVMERTRDPRLREIMMSMVVHLHAFVRDVRLTEAEFLEATAILNEMGKLTSDTHNEMVPMAGSLGVSSLTCLLNNGDNGNTETSQSLLGPFWRLDSPQVPNGGTIIRSATPGEALFVSARVQDQTGQPIVGAEIDVWHASPVGLYENQDPEQAAMNLRGKLTTDDDGAQIRADTFVKPRIEVELAFIMGEDLEGPGTRTYDVLRATEFVLPALEIIDYRTEVPHAIVDTIADNAAFGAIVVGGRTVRPMDVDLRWIGATLSRMESSENPACRRP
jgi:hypothetical protein